MIRKWRETIEALIKWRSLHGWDQIFIKNANILIEITVNFVVLGFSRFSFDVQKVTSLER